MMGLPEEPEHSMFDGYCIDCGIPVRYSAPIKAHPDNVRCEPCWDVWTENRMRRMEERNENYGIQKV